MLFRRLPVGHRVQQGGGGRRRVAAPARCEVCRVGVPAIPNGHRTCGTGCRRHNEKENVMVWKNWQVSALATLFTLAVLCGVRAQEVKPSDEGKAAEFKGKAFDMKAK